MDSQEFAEHKPTLNYEEVEQMLVEHGHIDAKDIASWDDPNKTNLIPEDLRDKAIRIPANNPFFQHEDAWHTQVVLDWLGY